MANFLDTIIDYPNSKIYATEFCQRLNEIEVLTEEQTTNYKKHIENVEKQSSDSTMN